MSDSSFDKITALPSEEIQERSQSLIGFEKKFNRIHSSLQLLLDKEGVIKWSNENYGKILPIVSSIEERHPLIIFEGDVGTGKTVTAECIADRTTRELNKEGFFLQLSTRVRGEGLHGEMGNLVNDAFDKLKQEAGKRRLAFLLIDEADAIATSRGTQQMHQEEKAAVNTLIQRLDELRSMKGRAVVFMSTNRLHYLDEAIVRRAAIVLEFKRPDFEERYELFKHELEGASFSEQQLKELAELTGGNENNAVSFTFSDLRLRLLPEVISKAFLNKSKVSIVLIKETINDVKPSPEIK
jgi:AAA+ superfamily predicted ATPase